MNRAEAVTAIVSKTGKSPQQAEAFLDILGSAFARRGWVPGKPLGEEQIEERLGVFLGEQV